MQTLEQEGRITGVMDDRGKFIYISREEMAATAQFILARGRVAISELAAQSATFIDLEPKCAAAHMTLPSSHFQITMQLQRSAIEPAQCKAIVKVSRWPCMKALLSRQISSYLGITPAACANAGRRQLPTSQILTGILERRGN